MTRRLALALAAALALGAGCSSKKEPSSQPGASAASGAGSSGSGYEALGNKPANARRPTAPPNIEAKAIAVGAKAPDVEVTDPTGAKWRLADALGKHARVMLVFYRGDW